MVGVGNLRVSQEIDGKKTTTLLQNVGYAPKCRMKLVYLRKAQRAGVEVTSKAVGTKMSASYKGCSFMIGDIEATGICYLTGMLPVSREGQVVSFFTAGEDGHTVGTATYAPHSGGYVEENGSCERGSWDRRNWYCL